MNDHMEAHEIEIANHLKNDVVDLFDGKSNIVCLTVLATLCATAIKQTPAHLQKTMFEDIVTEIRIRAGLYETGLN